MYFQKGRLTLGKLMYRFVERSPQDTRDGFDLYSAQTSFAWPRIDLARLLRCDDFRLSFEFVKVCWIHFSSLESFIGFNIWCYPISTIHSMFIYRWSWPRCHLVPPTLCIILYGGWIWANYLENSFEQRATTTNCRVSFIDLYIVFPRNFRIVFLPYTNTVILLEPYFGTIREPGFPVLKPTIIRASKLYFYRLF